MPHYLGKIECSTAQLLPAYSFILLNEKNGLITFNINAIQIGNWDIISNICCKSNPILDNMFHCKCMKMNFLFFIRILLSYGCWDNGWISWFPVSTVNSLILLCVSIA